MGRNALIKKISVKIFDTIDALLRLYSAMLYPNFYNIENFCQYRY